MDIYENGKLVNETLKWRKPRCVVDKALLI